MRAIVTGGAGFIGSHLVEALLRDSHHVLVVDNLSTGRPTNLGAFESNSCFAFEQADINDTKRLAPLFAGVDWVFHLAALADIVPSIQQPYDYHHSNVDGTFAVLELARAGGAKRFLYAASSSCYGIPDHYPTPESAEIRPMYPYALTKYVGEQYVLHWAKVYGLPAVALRLFNVYGPRSRTSGTYGAVFGVFLAQKLAKKPFTVVGDGSQRRDFTFVTDVANAFVAAAASDLTGIAMNVGSGQSYSINQLVALLGGEVVYIPKRPGEPDETRADIALVRSRLGWEARVGFEKGVGIMLDNIAYWRDAPLWSPGTIAEATKDWFRYLGKSA
jgi:UDP-glucose 4-epimerase